MSSIFFCFFSVTKSSQAGVEKDFESKWLFQIASGQDDWKAPESPPDSLKNR
jgi:hypothetical protein